MGSIVEVNRLIPLSKLLYCRMVFRIFLSSQLSWNLIFPLHLNIKWIYNFIACSIILNNLCVTYNKQETNQKPLDLLLLFIYNQTFMQQIPSRTSMQHLCVMSLQFSNNIKRIVTNYTQGFIMGIKVICLIFFMSRSN